MKKVLYLYSDKTGLIKGDHFHKRIIKKLSKKYDITVHKTSSVEDLISCCQTAVPTYEYVFICGGDGSLKVAVSSIAVLPKNQRPVIGYLPCGTVNDSGKSFGVKGTIQQAIRILIKGNVIPIDICKANNDFFTFVAAVGQYSDISYIVPRKKKKIFGRLAYYDVAVKEALMKKVIHISMEIEGKTVTVEAPFIMVCNGVNVGGFKVNKHNSLTDGLVDIYITKPTIFNGITNFLWHKDRVLHFQGKKLKIHTAEKESWCLDGERGMNGDVEIEVLPAHIDVIGDRKTASGK